MTFEQLMREHDRIDALTLELERCCADPSRPVQRVIAAREHLKEVLEHHLSNEDESIYPGLMLHNAQSPNAISSFVSAFCVLREDWETYLGDWDAECLAADWDNFVADTTELMARVRDRTSQETSLIYPLALREGAIGLRNT